MCHPFLCPATNSFGLSEVGDIANTIVAFFTLVLGFYVFIYQRSKDKTDTIEAEKNHERNLKLQWFKELIILPRIKEVSIFYEGLNSLKPEIDEDNLNEDQKIRLINIVKDKQAVFRKAFIDSLLIISKKLYNDALLNIDVLTDDLTNSISNDELELSNARTFEKEIGTKIQYSEIDLYALIFNYKGESE